MPELVKSPPDARFVGTSPRASSKVSTRPSHPVKPGGRDVRGRRSRVAQEARTLQPREGGAARLLDGYRLTPDVARAHGEPPSRRPHGAAAADGVPDDGWHLARGHWRDDHAGGRRHADGPRAAHVDAGHAYHQVMKSRAHERSYRRWRDRSAGAQSRRAPSETSAPLQRPEVIRRLLGSMRQLSMARAPRSPTYRTCRSRPYRADGGRAGGRRLQSL